MTKPEILEVVKQMLADWQDAYDSKDIQTVYDLNCHIGFCAYLLDFNCSYEMLITRVLYSDLIEPRLIETIWYDSFFKTKKFESLLPRIDHLQRTIARLEKEIDNENTTS